ncbi:MAG: ATP-dependent 6-phosphofructokinase [Planctomycetota bacterium]
MSKKRIGILTSGGDCPGLNAVIRGAVKASTQMGYDCVGFLKGYEGLYDPVQYVHLTSNSTRGILNQGGTILGSTNKGRFAATVGVQDRLELDPELIEGVKATIDQLGIEGLICVGGDGSLAVAQQFHEQGIKVVGVPKTIDNDLSATAFTFGFDSAIECATDALDRLHTTAASHERIMVLEVMGRHAGWIALHSGIAGGGDVILLPEIPWTYENLCHKILHRESQGKKFTLVVVAEGAELPSGGLVGDAREGQQMKLGGVGRAVTDEIERRLHRETRLCVLGHLQRGGNPTTFDRVLATQFGAHAVRLIHEERFGEMICSCPPEMKSVPIIEAVNVLRQVDPHGPAVQAARALGISFGDRTADEIGANVFDRLEPVAHVADVVAETCGTKIEPAVEAEPVAEVVEEVVAEEIAPEPQVQVVEETASVEVVASSPEPEALDEDAAAEQVVETVLDLAADADELIHGAVHLVEEEPTESAEEEPRTEQVIELPETDSNPLEEVLAEALPEPAPAVEPEVTIEEKAETPTPEPKPLPDLSAAQAQLADRIADAAKASREVVAESTEVDPAIGELSVADLVKQKLAAAAASAKPTLESPVDEPHGEDLVAEARSALEEALSD